MATLNFNDKSYACVRAQKGSDFIRLLDGSGKVILFAEGISDFSKYELVDGSWENPMAVVAPAIGVNATLSNALIVLDVPAFVNIETGLHITFVAPCNCDAATGLSINGTAYNIVDALGNNIAALSGGAFCLGAIVSIILDATNNKAYIQNAASALGASSGEDEGGSEEEEVEEPSTAELDFSNWDNGSFTETLADGTTITHTVGFNSSGNVVNVGGIQIVGIN